MILKGEKVVLRPIKMSDAPRFVKWFNDPKVNRFLDKRNMTLKEEQKFIRERNTKKISDQVHFCIDTQEGVHIGAIDLRHVTKFHRRAELGVMIGDMNYWSKGYGTSAINVLLTYAFGKLKLHRVYLGVYSYNTRAIKLYEKLGFVHEGVSREAARWQNKYWDAYRMSILEKEWAKIIKNHQRKIIKV
jgi:RimJ/RimL family protein N-acetyltransferase